MPNKLHLKRTPQEEYARRLRKQQKKESKRRSHFGKEPTSHKRRRTTSDQDKWDSSDEDKPNLAPASDESSHGGPSSQPQSPYNPGAYKPDYDEIRAKIEEERFREKMSAAFEDDDRLDSIETRFNQYAHIPDRWRTGSARSTRREYSALDYSDLTKLDSSCMDEEEYAEWIRAGMYRKTHAEEYNEQKRREAAKAARRATEKAIKAETERLEKIAEEERRRKKREKESRRWDYAREEYAMKWRTLLSADDSNGSVASLGFDDIPWPIVAAYQRKKGSTKNSDPTSVSIEDLTAEAISVFLVSTSEHSSPLDEREKKERREKLREAFLRFHPDKFEGRIMKRVREEERNKVGEAIGQVVRVLNALMGDGS